MPSPPLDSTLDRMTFGVACHHCDWATHTIERHRAWHDITSLGMHAWSDDVRRCITSPPLDSTSVGNIGRGMKSLPFDSTHGRSTSGMAFNHCLWQHIRSNDVGRGMTSLPLDSTHGRTNLGMTCHHRPCTARTVGRRQAWHAIIAFGQHTRLNDIGRGMQSSPLGSRKARMTSAVA